MNKKLLRFFDTYESLIQIHRKGFLCKNSSKKLKMNIKTEDTQ